MIPSIPVAATNEDEALYLRRLDRSLLELDATGNLSLDVFVEGALGADPLLVRARLRELGISLPDGALPSKRDDIGREWNPELHPLDFEWYFTSGCALELARTAVALGPDLLCLGAPTVAYAAESLVGSPTDLLLVDQTPLARRRAPGDLRRFEFHQHDLDAPLRLDRRFSVAIFDAPWYPAQLHAWLAEAVRLVGPGGSVLFPLLRDLHRPTASADRTRVLEQAAAIGHVTLDDAAITYESPLFERRSLAIHGIAGLTQWRTADLVRLRVERAGALPPVSRRRNVRDRWDTFIVGSQVVKLSRRAPVPGRLTLAPIPGCQDFRYDGISTRDPRRSMIDLWTSRNRVAQTTRTDLLRLVLRFMTEGHQPAEAVTRALPDHEARHRATLAEALEDVLESSCP